MLYLAALVLCAQPILDRDVTFDRLCQVGETGKLPQHTELYRGKFLEDSATVRHVFDNNTALMRCVFAVTTARLEVFEFVIKGVDTEGWERGEIKQLAPRLKVTGWYSYRTSDGRKTEVQQLEPLPAKPKP